MRYEPHTLVAVTAGDDGSIFMIGRVISDSGEEVTVRSDDQLEGEAAREHGFQQPPQRTVTVPHAMVRLILPRVN